MYLELYSQQGMSVTAHWAEGTQRSPEVVSNKTLKVWPGVPIAISA